MEKINNSTLLFIVTVAYGIIALGFYCHPELPKDLIWGIIVPVCLGLVISGFMRLYEVFKK